MNVLRLRILTTVFNTAARLVHGYPRAVLGVLAGIIIALASLAILGAVALISDPAAWKLYLFAAAWLAAFVWLAGKRPWSF
jgi:hypothetical protein